MERFGEEILLQYMHGGIEPGAFARINPNLEMVCFGPDIFDAHSIDERVSVKTVTWFSDYLEAILSCLCDSKLYSQ